MLSQDSELDRRIPSMDDELVDRRRFVSMDDELCNVFTNEQ